MTPAMAAAEAYNLRVTRIRAKYDQRTRAYADAMSAASAEYEAAIGSRAAARLGAGR